MKLTPAGGGYETTEFAVLVNVGHRKIELPCEDARDALQMARDIGPIAKPVIRRTKVTDWMVIDAEWAT